ncbi:MAG: hypothetical protein HYR55_08525 [Acidobacteria bacterium]|nr:hypothetical protein [Acidobacteriota bacterium]MBI3657745.1 hypothetical protein [Acidobacteriota bacterium]
MISLPNGCADTKIQGGPGRKLLMRSSGSRCLAGVLSLLTLLIGNAMWIHAGPRFGVAIAPYMDGGDEVEKIMYKLAGQMPQVDRVYTAADPAQFYDILMKLKRMGRQVDFLVIMGHGSKTTPGIQFPVGSLDHGSVDLVDMQLLQAKLENKLATQRLNHEDSREIEQRLEQVKRRVQYLDSVADVMAPHAEVLLINCSVAATEEGRTFVLDLGEVLLHKRGGVVIASRSDVAVDQVNTIAQKLHAWFFDHGGWVPINDFFAGGNWHRFVIKAADTADAPARAESLTPISPPHRKPEGAYYGAAITLSVFAGQPGERGAEIYVIVFPGEPAQVSYKDRSEFGKATLPLDPRTYGFQGQLPHNRGGTRRVWGTYNANADSFEVHIEEPGVNILTPVTCAKQAGAVIRKAKKM